MTPNEKYEYRHIFDSKHWDESDCKNPQLLDVVDPVDPRYNPTS